VRTTLLLAAPPLIISTPIFLITEIETRHARASSASRLKN